MGLMYIFPTSDAPEEGDRAEQKNGAIILRTYGLPMIFWGYYLAATSVVFLMWLASRDIIKKLINYDDPSLYMLGHLVQWFLILSPLVALGFFFYEKVITKKEAELSLTYRLFFIPFFKKTYKLKSADAIEVNHFLASPNMARLRRQQGIDNAEALKHFETKGYFELNLMDTNGKTIIFDRHSRKADLIKMKELLLKY